MIFYLFSILMILISFGAGASAAFATAEERYREGYCDALNGSFVEKRIEKAGVAHYCIVGDSAILIREKA